MTTRDMTDEEAMAACAVIRAEAARKSNEFNVAYASERDAYRRAFIAAAEEYLGI